MNDKFAWRPPAPYKPRPIDVYYEGRKAYKDNPHATTWEGILPYGVSHLVNPWLDGWNDEKENKKPLLPFGVEDGRCPNCYGYRLRARISDGAIICIQYPCCGSVAHVDEQ